MIEESIMSFNKDPSFWNQKNYILLMLIYIEKCENDMNLFNIDVHGNIKTTKTLSYCKKLFKKYFSELKIYSYYYKQIPKAFSSQLILYLKLNIDTEIFNNEYRNFMLGFFKLVGLM